MGKCGLGSWRTERLFFLLPHVLCHPRAVSHWKTRSLAFGAPKARGHWLEAVAELTGMDLLWETGPGYTRGHSPSGRKARYFFGNIMNVHQGTIVFMIPIWKQGDLFIYFDRPDEVIQTSSPPFKSMFLSYWMSETKSFQLVWPFSVSLQANVSQIMLKELLYSKKC